MSQILDPNGNIPKKEPPNIPSLVQTARDKWKLGHKQQAFEMVLAAIELLSKGVARCFMDISELKKRSNDATKPEA